MDPGDSFIGAGIVTHIPYGRQSITDADILSVVDVLRSDWLTQGPIISQFESELARYCNAAHAVAAMNATAALHLACLALGVQKGDIVWTSPNTFLASANCVRFCGADIDFVDICSKTYNMSIVKLEEKLMEAKRLNKLPKAIIPVHFAGQSCDMRAIRALADKYDFKIIEDASHAVGGRYLDEPVGNCQFSDITIFSFHPVKIMTTGEGGALLTNDKMLADKVKLLRSHGMTRDEKLMMSPSEGGWYYQQVKLGFNYRITDLQCALGLSQIKRVDEFVKKRNTLVMRYNDKLKDLPLILPFVNSDCYSAYHLYVVQLDSNEALKKRKEVFDYLLANNIGVNVHYIPVHLQPYYQQFGFKLGDFPNAEIYYQHAITLPLYYDLREEDQDYVITKLKEILI